MKPNYKNSIMNVSNSILKYYNAYTPNSTHKLMDKYLIKDKYDHIVYVLLDGLGVNLINKFLSNNDMMKRNMVATISSVFPPTTVAATNAVLSGLKPIENGHIGWVQYFKELDSNAIVFMNRDFYDETVVFEENLQEKYLKYDNLYKLINDANPKIKTLEFFPSFREGGSKSFEEQVDKVLNTIYEYETTFSYVYWIEPDLTQHQKGIYSAETKDVVIDLNKHYTKLINEVKEDTLVVVIADHGLVDIEDVNLMDNVNLLKMLKRLPSIEPRATSFFVKNKYLDEFKKEFNKSYKDKFKLYTKKQFYKSGLIGKGKKHHKLDEFIGDFMAIAKKNYMFKLNLGKSYIAQHAGMTKDEMEVPLIINRKDF